MPKVVAKSIYNKLLRSAGFLSIMERLAVLSGMDCYFLDALGNIALSVPRRPNNAFVLLLQRQAETRRLLEKNRQALLAGDCSTLADSGYNEIAHRLFLDTETVGYLMLSACRGKEQDMEASRATWTGLARQGSTVSWGSWRESWLAMPEQSVVQHEAWRQTLALYARDAVRQLEPDLHPDPQVLPSLVRQACSQIQKEHAEPLHLKDVARRMGVSAEHLSRLFHQNTGLRFREYLAETRIDTACRALKNSDLPISQIAHESGFATLSRFNECFKKHRNMTPREWRKRARLSSRALSPSVEF